MTDTVKFLNASFDRMSPKEAVEALMVRLLARKGGRIYYGNAHTMVTASNNQVLAKVLQEKDLLLADGAGVRWGSALLGTPLVHNLNGTDLVPALCKAGAAKNLSLYLLGAKPGIAEEAAIKLTEKYPGLVIAGTQDGYFSQEETPQVLDSIRAAQPHILLVGMGVPRQEFWIHQYASQLPGITCMGVGGLFDFLSERIPRAPLWVRQHSMEWLWRLTVEPRRLWRRYIIGNCIFIGLVLTYAIGNLSEGSTIAGETHH
ncbi:WecB/TagA/CpsF family glycosyltransferase [Lyngbya aestuarii]|uniref:WecB/TagA/CpsF family glycosyltransferase n=1 Tax=Lyngbya aestuarii TaxID=118322 RepID=UPI00403D82CE